VLYTKKLLGLQKIISSATLLKFFSEPPKPPAKAFKPSLAFRFCIIPNFLGQLAQKTRDLISEANKQQKFFDITEKTKTTQGNF
jgi:hypothetical protein